MYEKIFYFIFVILFSISLLNGCKTTDLSSYNRTRIDDYRELQSEIGDGETELAITSERISNDSSEIKESSEQLRNQLIELERTIKESETDEQEIGEILQRIRAREITREQLIELGIEIPD